jgi:hypothetical protein
MKPKTAFITGISAAALFLGGIVVIAPASSAAVCNDGSFSMSSGRGTCSWHGGVMGGGSSRNNGGYDPFGYGSPKRGGNSYGYGYGNDSSGSGSGGSKYNSKRYGW